MLKNKLCPRDVGFYDNPEPDDVMWYDDDDYAQTREDRDEAIGDMMYDAWKNGDFE